MQNVRTRFQPSRPGLCGFGIGNPILKNGAIEQLSLAGQEEAAAAQVDPNWRTEKRSRGAGVA